MPTAKFETTVEVARASEHNREVAVANCASYVAYADQTDTFGYHGVVDDAVVIDAGPPNYYVETVTFWWTAPVANPDDIQKVADEMSRLSRVESHECITNATNAEI
jgi:hypothetical protein